MDQQPAMQQPQAMPQAAPEAMPAGPQAMPKGRMPLLPIGIGLVVIIVVIAAIFLFVSRGSSSPGTQNSTGVQSGANSQSSQLASQLSSPSNQTLTSAITIVLHKIISTSQFNASYTGLVKLYIQGSSGISINSSMPVKFNFQKLGNNSRIEFSARGVPLFGNMTGVAINLVNGTAYSCSNTTFGTLLSFQNEGIVQNTGMQCQRSSSVGTTFNQEINTFALFDTTQNSQFKVMGQSSYMNQGCVLVVSNGSSSTGNYALTMCLSDQYYVPLTLSFSETINESQKGSLNVALNETSIDAPVTLAGLSSLPGPIVNATENAQSGYGTGSTTIPSSGSGSYSAGGTYSGSVTCTPASTQFNCTVSTPTSSVYEGSVVMYDNGTSQTVNGTFLDGIWISQDTGTSWQDVNLAYVPLGGTTAIVQEATASGVNENNMTSHSSSIGTLLVNFPISKSESGSFDGTIWARYTTPGSTGWQYAVLAVVNGTT
jgi:hypothetical protein